MTGLGDGFWEDVLGRASTALQGVFGSDRQNMDFRYGRDDLNPNPRQNLPTDWPTWSPPNLYSQMSAPWAPPALQTPSSLNNPFLTGLKLPSLTALMQRRSAPQGGATDPTADPEVEGFIRQEAQALGIDPETAVRVAMSEGGIDAGSRARQNKQGAPAYGPFQLYIGGGEGDAALAAGIDPRNASQWKESVRFALRVARQKGWTPFQGAAGAGIGPWQGIGSAGSTYDYSAPTRVSDGAPVRDLHGITPAQFGQAGIDQKLAEAICGPVAAVAFAHAVGRNPSVVEALNLARDGGLWSFQTGMRGAASTVKLLDRLGVPTQLGGVQSGRIIAELQAGRPVIIDTDAGANGHYFVAEGYDPRTGRFDFGESARALRSSGGRTQYTLDELASLGFGSPAQAIYMRTN